MATAQAPSSRRQERFLRAAEKFRESAFMIILKMLELNRETPERPTVLVDEIIHSIFFLGLINKPPFRPEQLINVDEMRTRLEEKFPRPFELYTSQLPQRTPFSCVLDMIVLQTGQEDERAIKRKLQDFISSLELGDEKYLVSSTMCVSQNGEDSDRYYGVSLSSTGTNPVRIMVAASCLHTWDERVAAAVMTYFPDAESNPWRSNFRGTIKLPENVRCQAFTISTGEELPPCQACHDLFGLNTQSNDKWGYGNCAEAESLSNLLKNEIEVKEQVCEISEHYTEEQRKRAEEDVRRNLTFLFSQVNGRDVRFTWDNDWYQPGAPPA